MNTSSHNLMHVYTQHANFKNHLSTLTVLFDMRFYSHEILKNQLYPTLESSQKHIMNHKKILLFSIFIF